MGEEAHEREREDCFAGRSVAHDERRACLRIESLNVRVVYGLEFRIWGSGFGVEGLGLRVWSWRFRFKDLGVGFEVKDLG